VARVSAAHVEGIVVRALRERWPDASNERELIAQHLDCAVLQSDVLELRIHAAPAKANRMSLTGECDPIQSDEDTARANTEVICLVYSRPVSTRRRKNVIQSTGTVDGSRPIRAERRATLVRAIALGRRWLAEIADGSAADAGAIAAREECSKRLVMMTISLAFLSPALVTAAVAGRLPRGIGLREAVDLPMEWARQHQMLGV
jgi:site-specific DNA recombinase